MDAAGNERGGDLGASIQIDVAALEQFLKRNFEGDDVRHALRYRTMVHWLHPEADRLSARMLPVYTELMGHIEWPFSILDVGCMTGWLKHFIAQRIQKPFQYVGMDMWQEALDVAKEFDPYIDVRKLNILEDEIPGPLGDGFEPKYTYTWCSNIQFGKNAPKVIQKMMDSTRVKAFFGMPDYCGDYAEMAKELGFKAETIDCGNACGSHQTLVKVWR